MSTVPKLSWPPLILFFVQPLSGNCYKLSSIVTFTFIQIFLSKLCLLYWMTSELPRLLDTASKFALFSVSGLKDENLIKKQIYMKTETCKLYYRVFWIILPNVISKLIITSLSYIVSKLVHFLRHSVLTLEPEVRCVLYILTYFCHLQPPVGLLYSLVISSTQRSNVKQFCRSVYLSHCDTVSKRLNISF